MLPYDVGRDFSPVNVIRIARPVSHIGRHEQNLAGPKRDRGLPLELMFQRTPKDVDDFFTRYRCGLALSMARHGQIMALKIGARDAGLLLSRGHKRR